MKGPDYKKRMEGVGVLLRDAREARGLSLYDLAHKTGISRQSLIAVEKGRADPKLTTVLRIADALGLRFILEGEI